MPENNSSQRILITPLKPGLIHGVAQKLPVLVRVQAPEPPPSQEKQRNRYHLSLVIDRSGSMSGEPLREAVRCARYIIDKLEPNDVASLITFDDRVNILVPARPVGDRKAIHAALAGIHSGGSTNLHGGWKAGFESLLPDAGQAAIARIILLSDGNANVGDFTSTEDITKFCADAAKQGVSTSTYGLGRDFNEDLMVGMGRRGAGNHYYGDTSADLFEPFVEEFDFISSLFARNVGLSLAAPQGVKIRLLNDYPVEERDGFPLVALPDIPFGAEAWALVELEIPAGLVLESGNQFLQAEVTATTPDGQPLAFLNESLSLQSYPVAAWDALLADPLVQARLKEIEASEFLDKARKVAENGDWDAIKRMIDEGRTRFADNPWVQEVLNGLAELAEDMDGARFRKEALYASRKMQARVAACLESVGDGMGVNEATPSFLRRKGRQGKAQPPTS